MREMHLNVAKYMEDPGPNRPYTMSLPAKVIEAIEDMRRTNCPRIRALLRDLIVSRLPEIQKEIERALG